MQRAMRALVFDLRYIGQEDITVVYRMKILKTRRRDDLRSRRARKDEVIVSKHHGSIDSIFFFPSSRIGNSNRRVIKRLYISSLFELSMHQCH